MELPLLPYNPTTQNHRVRDFGPADRDEDEAFIYRLTDDSSSEDLDAIIWAAYRQIFSEHQLLDFNRQKSLESLLRNRSISVRDFVRGIAKSERFYELVVSTNNCYRLVNVCFKRLLGRAPYNQDEEIAWSVKTSTLGFHGFVDVLLDSEEYLYHFGDDIVPYQRRRMGERPFNLVTPRYGREYYERELAVTGHPDWQFIMAKFYHRKHHERPHQEGDPRKYRDWAMQMSHKPRREEVSTIKIGNFDVDYFLRKWLGRGSAKK